MQPADRDAIKTYRMVERAERLDFEVRDQSVRPPLVRPHRHEYFQTQVNRGGPAFHIVGGLKRPFLPRSLVFILPYRVHYVDHPPGSHYSIVNCAPQFLMPGAAGDPARWDLQTPQALQDRHELLPFVCEGDVDFCFDAADFARICDLLEHATRLNAARGLGSTERLRAVVLELIGLALQRFEAPLQAALQRRTLHHAARETLQEAGRFIEAHLHRDLTLAEVADTVHLSPPYLSQLLKKHTGQSFVQWLGARRMDRAQELLAHGGSRIAEVARAVGFEDEAYFSRRFRQRLGMSPRDYRQQFVLAGTV